jgi:CDP-6-deoxy-D-xylo-4-hexulose-3-dehydrase
MLWGAVPVFVDVRLPTYNIDTDQLETARSERTRAVMIAHTLGNPFELETVRAFCDRYGLWLIEDCCDALGSLYMGRPVGQFGDIGTLSFYPAHHITMGEGGAVFTRSGKLARIMASFRDWGRDCYCEPGHDDTCGKRFDWDLGELPQGYDHKYVYSHLGFNLKITDMQAACGLAQLDRLDGFIAARRRNFQYLRERLAGLEDRLILPEATPGSEPSWFGFPITLRPDAGGERRELLRYLEAQGVGTRLLFGGDLTRQPYMAGRHHRRAGELRDTETVMNRCFWIGLWPGVTEPMLDHAAEVLQAGLSKLCTGSSQ